MKLLQEDPSLQNLQLAERAELSPSARRLRVKALVDAGLIRGDVALIEGKAIGAGFIAFVEVRLEKQTARTATAFERAVATRPEILECSMVTGDYDSLHKVALADLDELCAFLSEGLTRLEGVADTRTVVPIKRIKDTRAVRVR